MVGNCAPTAKRANSGPAGRYERIAGDIKCFKSAASWMKGGPVRAGRCQ